MGPKTAKIDSSKVCWEVKKSLEATRIHLIESYKESITNGRASNLDRLLQFTKLCQVMSA